MSDYFQGKFCIVDLREIQCVHLELKETTLELVRLHFILKGSDTQYEVKQEAKAFLEAYRKWIERQNGSMLFADWIVEEAERITKRRAHERTDRDQNIEV